VTDESYPRYKLLVCCVLRYHYHNCMNSPKSSTFPISNHLNLLLNEESDISRIATTGLCRLTVCKRALPIKEELTRGGITISTRPHTAVSKERKDMTKWITTNIRSKKERACARTFGSKDGAGRPKQAKGACRGTEYNAGAPQANGESGTGCQCCEPMLLGRALLLGIYWQLLC
jgi:hypothetical protein